MTLQEAEREQKVIYFRDDYLKPEKAVITSKNSNYVFIQTGNLELAEGITAQAVQAKHLIKYTASTFKKLMHGYEKQEAYAHGLEWNKWYVVEVSFSRGNPTHRAIANCTSDGMHKGEKVESQYIAVDLLGSYEGILKREVASLNYFRVIRELTEMKDEITPEGNQA